MTAREKAFRQFLAELVRYLALPRRSQVKEKNDAYMRLMRYATKAHDPNAYLFRLGRALTYEGRHRHARDEPSRVQRR